MSKIQETNGCGRGEQLVAYLYGESGERERAEFEGHLAACAECGAELAAFAQVREAVGEWRAQLLAHAPSVEDAELLPATAALRAASDSPARSHAEANGRTATNPRTETNRRAAWDALREFFALSPAWLRYGTVAAAVVVCALAALAVANARVSYENGKLAFSTGLSREPSKMRPVQPSQTASTPDAATPDAAQLSQLVAERDAARRELEETRAQLEDSRAANIDAVYQEIDESQPADSAKPDATAAPAPRTRRSQGARQVRSARRAQQSDDDLPRLIDLLNSGN